MSRKIKVGDKVKVMHSITNPVNRRGEKGKMVIVDNMEGIGLVKFKDGSEYRYDLSCLRKASKKLKFKDLEVGGCYICDNTYIRVEGVDGIGSPYGTYINVRQNHVKVWHDTNRLKEVVGNKKFKKITHEEFEYGYQEARREITRIYKMIKTQSDEKDILV